MERYRVSKKICFLGSDFGKLGGVEITTKNLVYGLKNLLCDSDDIAINAYSIVDSSNTSNDIDDKWYKVIPVNIKNKYIKIAYSIYYLSVVKKYDCIITSYFLLNVINVLFSIIMGHKAVIQEHSSYHYDGFLKRIIKIVSYRFSWLFIVLNKYDYNRWSKYLLKPIVIFNVVDVPVNKHRRPKGDYFLVCSRLDKNKRVDLIIDAYKKYRFMGGGLKLIVLGDGPEYERLVMLSHGTPEIVFHGAINKPYDFYSSCKALLIASKLECLPTSVIEATKHGKPTIAFNVPSGMSEVITDNVNGYLIDNDDKHMYAMKMLEVECSVNINDIEHGCKLISEKFDNNVIISTYLNIFKKLHNNE